MAFVFYLEKMATKNENQLDRNLKESKMTKLVLVILIFCKIMFSAEHNPMPFERYDDVVSSVLKLNSSSMGGFMDAMKSYIVYTAVQTFQGQKSLGRVLF